MKPKTAEGVPKWAVSIAKMFGGLLLACTALVIAIQAVPWFEKQRLVSQHLSEVQNRFDSVATFEAELIGEHVGWAQCGSSQADSAVYTRLYRTSLSRSELESMSFSSPSMGIWIVGSTSDRGPNLYPCLYYPLYEGYNLMEYDLVLQGVVYFILYDFAPEIGVIEKWV